MGNQQGAPINEVVALLDRENRKKLIELRELYPEISDELKLGIWGGKADIDERKQKRLLRARAEVAFVGLRQAIQDCSQAIEAASWKIQISNKIRLGGQIVTVIGSSSVLGALGNNQNLLAVIAGIFALLGSLSSIFLDYAERIIGSSGESIESIYLELSLARHDAELFSKNLRISIDGAVDDAFLEMSIGEANALCERLNLRAYKIIERTRARRDQ